jgi:carbon storage regulator
MRRRQGETILIGEEIEVHIAHIGRSRVKVAIEAPRSMRVVAKEEKMAGDQNQAAAVRMASVFENSGKLSSARPICVGEAGLGRPGKNT